MKCRICQKPFSQTYAQAKFYERLCKMCKRLVNALWREKHPDYENQLKAKPERMQKRAAQMQGYYRNDPQRFKTRAKTRRLIESGQLKREPCEKCGEKQVQPHHTDYSDAFNVNWLCRPCHRAEHAKLDGV